MADFESLFNASILKVSVPDTSVEFPPKGSTDEWLARLNSGSAERKQAFFGAQRTIVLGGELIGSRQTSSYTL